MKWQSCAPALVGLACATLAGCGVGTPYRRLDIAPPQQWHEVAPDSAPASVWPAADRWHGFGSTRLDELIAEAEPSNGDPAGAIARVREADAQLRIAGAPVD
jgi:multidrug efflux system outer membrane protein